MNSDKKIHLDKHGPHEQDTIMYTDGICRCICVGCHGNTNSYLKIYVEKDDVMKRYSVRKLTPRECFRLMGVEDKDIDTLLAAGISDGQLYKMAGNSIVVDPMYHILNRLLTGSSSKDDETLW